jgi:hypothetical protein
MEIRISEERKKVLRERIEKHADFISEYGYLMAHLAVNAALYPLDSIKTQMQAKAPVQNLSRGVIPSSLSMISNIYATSFYLMKVSEEKNNSLPKEIGVGAFAAFPNLVSVPFERLKVKFQTSCNIKSNITGNVIVDSFKNIFKGWQITLVRDIVGLSVFTATFNSVRPHLRSNNENYDIAKTFITSWIVQQLFTFPLDTIKSRIQADVDGDVRSCVRNMFKERERALLKYKVSLSYPFYRGYHFAIMRLSLYGILSFGIMDMGNVVKSFIF